MTPERWQQIRAVFEQAEPLIDGERAQFLDRSCAGDAELRDEVESLLKAAADAGGDFLGTPAADLMQPPPPREEAASRIGRRIGPYKIEAEIGHGGMGEVYRATRIDGQFDQEVAIKLVRVGMGSPFIVQRLLQERQILASLNHPHIARLLDGGSTEDGVPYLAMELIDGERIDVYCESRKLSVTERLRLFLEVCSAVQYAHQRLVVHRDLKPSNILVTRDGVPKLLDFGIAKMLDPAADAETTIARPMTPEYASPEQIRGEAITTASDVYSLGVVLYQLLTGRSPYGPNARTPHEISRAITETQPQRPSNAVTASTRAEGKQPPSARPGMISSQREPTPIRLKRRLAGDIDNILLMALRKEPELRYGSVQQFADDISRHLDGLPITAAKGSWSYVARKFVVRHRTGLAATALVILALTAGIIATERQARIARMERARAQKRFDDVRKFSNSLIFDVHDALQSIPGTTSARSLLLDRAVQYLDSVTKDAEGDPELQRELAFGYQRLSVVQGDSTQSNTGQISASDLSAQKALALFEAVAKENPTNSIDQLNLAMVHRQKGINDIYYPDGRPELNKAIAITDRLMRTDGQNMKVLVERAIELQGMALSADISGDRNRSIDFFQQTLALEASIAQHDPNYSHLTARTAKTLVQLGWEFAFTGDMDRARAQVQAGIAKYQSLMSASPTPDTVRDLAQSRSRLAELELMRGDFSAANQDFASSQNAVAPLAKADPGNIMLRTDMLDDDYHQARLLALQGKFGASATQMEQVVAGFQKLGTEEDAGPGYGAMYAWIGEAQLGAHNYSQALESLQKSLKALEGDTQYDDGYIGIATCYVRMADANLALDRPAEADELYKKALAELDPESAKARRDIPALYPVAAAHLGRAELEIKLSLRAANPEERKRFRAEACSESAKNAEILSAIPAPPLFSPSDFPIPGLKSSAALRAACPSTSAPAPR